MKEPALPPLEEALLRACKAIDNQIARELQRSPEERRIHGVGKWAPYEKRVERIAGFLVEALGNHQIELDSLIVLSQSLPKALSMLVEELGSSNLGQQRATYCRAAGESLERDALRISDALGGKQRLT